ncbi:MAG: RNA 2'-phosphotransferase [Deltaproteobacteria bacterium]|nr:MAG: RNA 2'-phosphotransferase [Deltaproteobacteria bacterium]
MGKHQLKNLAKTIEYILLYRPDEFGLFLNDDGSLPIKELMWALHEDSGWRHVRPGHLKELVYSGLQLAFTVEEKRLRPKHEFSQSASVAIPPKSLFFAARRKAYPVILKHGLTPGGRPYVPLATTKEMAFRIGKRRDPKPILVTVHAARANDEGHSFLSCGELLYLTKELPPLFLSGPPIREVPQPRKAARPPVPSTREVEATRMPGSFLLDPARDPDPARRQRWKQEEDRKRRLSRERRRKRRR